MNMNIDDGIDVRLDIDDANDALNTGRSANKTTATVDETSRRAYNQLHASRRQTVEANLATRLSATKAQISDAKNKIERDLEMGDWTAMTESQETFARAKTEEFALEQQRSAIAAAPLPTPGWYDKSES